MGKMQQSSFKLETFWGLNTERQFQVSSRFKSARQLETRYLLQNKMTQLSLVDEMRSLRGQSQEKARNNKIRVNPTFL